MIERKIYCFKMCGFLVGERKEDLNTFCLRPSLSRADPKLILLPSQRVLQYIRFYLYFFTSYIYNMLGQIFLLVDLRIFFRFRVGGTKKKRKKALKMTS